jgi:hypothetical protein
VNRAEAGGWHDEERDRERARFVRRVCRDLVAFCDLLAARANLLGVLAARLHVKRRS